VILRVLWARVIEGQTPRLLRFIRDEAWKASQQPAAAVTPPAKVHTPLSPAKSPAAKTSPGAIAPGVAQWLKNPGGP